MVPLLRTYPSLKVWVAGCSTGEEVYSLAILLREEGLLERTLIYATDINANALQTAEAGVYAIDRIPSFTENHARSGGRGRCRNTTRPPMAAWCSTRACAGTSCSPTTAWRPTACSPRCTSSPAATCSSTSTANCRTGRWVSSARRSAARASWGWARRSRCAFRRTCNRSTSWSRPSASTRSGGRMIRPTAAPQVPARPFEAIVIGGSAGSIEALSVLLPALGPAQRRGVRGAAPAPRPAQPAVRDLPAALRAADARGAGQGACAGGHRLFRAARLPPAHRRRAVAGPVGR